MKSLIITTSMILYSILTFSQISPYSQAPRLSEWVAPIDADLMIRGMQYQRDQQQQYYEQQQRYEQQKQAQYQQELSNTYNANVELLNNIIASGYKCNATVSDGWHKVLMFEKTNINSGIRQVLVKENRIIDYYVNTNYDENHFSIDFSTSIANCKALIMLKSIDVSGTWNMDIYFVLE